MLNYRINFCASESKHFPGSRRQPGCQDPPAPGIAGRGNGVQQLLGDCGHKSWVVCRTRSRREGKGCPAEPGRSRRANCPARGKCQGLSAAAAGQDGPFSSGKLVENTSAELWLLDRQEGRGGTPTDCQRCGESPCPGALLEPPSHRRRGWEEEEEGREEGEEHQAAWLQFELLGPLHNFWIFSAITMGFSLRIFSAASAL